MATARPETDEDVEPVVVAQRYKLTIEYVGPAYRGSQRQLKQRTVQDELEAALSKLTHGPRPSTCFSGRTDAGVHAVGQVVHVDLARRSKCGEPLPSMEVSALLNALNFFLPERVGVVSACRVPRTFDARRSAVCRTYVYRIQCADVRPSPAGAETLRADACERLRERGWFSTLDKQRSLCLAEPLCVERMRAAAAVLQGEHDFTAFRGVRCTARSPVRRLLELSVVEEPPTTLDAFQPERPRQLSVRARARSFLLHQVRYLVAVLIEAGRANLAPQGVRALLEARDNAKAPRMAAAHGLYLAHVEYPPSAYEERGSDAHDPSGDDGDGDVDNLSAGEEVEEDEDGREQGECEGHGDPRTRTPAA